MSTRHEPADLIRAACVVAGCTVPGFMQLNARNNRVALARSIFVETMRREDRSFSEIADAAGWRSPSRPHAIHKETEDLKPRKLAAFSKQAAQAVALATEYTEARK